VGEVHEEQWKKRDSVHAGTHGNYGNYWKLNKST
jgi:hypothetical protein